MYIWTRKTRIAWHSMILPVSPSHNSSFRAAITGYNMSHRLRLMSPRCRSPAVSFVSGHSITLLKLAHTMSWSSGLPVKMLPRIRNSWGERQLADTLSHDSPDQSSRFSDILRTEHAHDTLRSYHLAGRNPRNNSDLWSFS